LSQINQSLSYGRKFIFIIQKDWIYSYLGLDNIEQLSHSCIKLNKENKLPNKFQFLYVLAMINNNFVQLINKLT
jgi:hypothetical protein